MWTPTLRKRAWSISAIAHHLGHDRKTIRAYLKGVRSAGVRAAAGVWLFDRQRTRSGNLRCKRRPSDGPGCPTREDGMLADEGQQSGPQFDWNSIPARYYTAAAIAVLVLLVILLVFGFIAYRRTPRSGTWRRAKLTLQAEILGFGPRQALAKLRLRLDRALSAATGAVNASRGVGAAGTLDSVNGQLQRVAERIAHRLDVIASTSTGSTLDRLLTPLQSRVDDVERLAGQIVDAAAAAMAGDAGIELAQVTQAVADEIQTVDLRLDALRELSHPNTGPEP